MNTIVSQIEKVFNGKEDGLAKMFLPINKIHGIGVSTYFEVCGGAKHTIRLVINHDRFYDDMNMNEERRMFCKFYNIPNKNNEEIMDVVKNCINIIKNLQFDKVCGRFYQVGCEDSINIELETAFLELLGENDHVELCGSDCCVCHERTRNTTACNHYVCIECASNIKPITNDDDECEQVPCPMCREDITLGYN